MYFIGQIYINLNNDLGKIKILFEEGLFKAAENIKIQHNNANNS